jgi:hypothetical protein
MTYSFTSLPLVNSCAVSALIVDEDIWDTSAGEQHHRKPPTWRDVIPTRFEVLSGGDDLPKSVHE